MIAHETKNNVCTVTIDRASRANALTVDMLNEMADIVEEASLFTRVLVLTGTGKVFSAGADLDEVRNNGLATDPAWERLSATVAGFPGLSIAALNGTLAGGAFGMALACDLRISVPGAKFFYPVMKMNKLPQPSDAGRLEDLVGPARKKLLLLAGAKLTAQEAYEFGLVDRITDDLDATLAELSADILAADEDKWMIYKELI